MCKSMSDIKLILEEFQNASQGAEGGKCDWLSQDMHLVDSVIKRYESRIVSLQKQVNELALALASYSPVEEKQSVAVTSRIEEEVSDTIMKLVQRKRSGDHAIEEGSLRENDNESQTATRSSPETLELIFPDSPSPTLLTSSPSREEEEEPPVDMTKAPPPITETFPVPEVTRTESKSGQPATLEGTPRRRPVPPLIDLTLIDLPIVPSDCAEATVIAEFPPRRRKASPEKLNQPGPIGLPQRKTRRRSTISPSPRSSFGRCRRLANLPAALFSTWKISCCPRPAEATLESQSGASEEKQEETPVDRSEPVHPKKSLLSSLLQNPIDGPPPLVPIHPIKDRDSRRPKVSPILFDRRQPILTLSQPSHMSSTNRVKLSWTIDEKDNDIAAFDVEVHSHLKGVRVPLIWRKLDYIAASSCPSRWIALELEKGYRYYFRIRAFTVGGSSTSFSQTQSIDL